MGGKHPQKLWNGVEPPHTENVATFSCRRPPYLASNIVFVLILKSRALLFGVKFLIAISLESLNWWKWEMTPQSKSNRIVFLPPNFICTQPKPTTLQHYFCILPLSHFWISRISFLSLQIWHPLPTAVRPLWQKNSQSGIGIARDAFA